MTVSRPGQIRLERRGYDHHPDRRTASIRDTVAGVS
jgi:hypothetical protein